MLAILASLGLHGIAAAQQSGIVPGEYITERGWGVLNIEPGRKGVHRFAIEAFGGNSFVCGLDGDMLNGTAVLDGAEAGKPCVVSFTPKGDGVEVGANDMRVCNVHCGAQASFPGLYLKVPPTCTRAVVQKTRDIFKVRYERKDFAAARAALEPVVKECGLTLDRFAGGWILNDLAITQHRLGDQAACRQTLAPLQKDASRSDQDIAAEYGAMDAEKYLPVVKAARMNLKLCGGSTIPQQP